MNNETWYLELSEDNSSHKFYEVTLTNSTLMIRYGRIGDAGQSSSKTFETAEKARAEAEKKLGEKRKKGYVDAIVGEREKRALPPKPVFPKLKIVGFTEVLEPITELITKFGGQPVWLEEPRWPICIGNGYKIPFMCQIDLTHEVLGGTSKKMAYIFFGGNSDGGREGWPTDHGDCAVVIQPGNFLFNDFNWHHWKGENKRVSQIPGGDSCFVEDRLGPTLLAKDGKQVGNNSISKEVEYLPITVAAEDPAYSSCEDHEAWSDERKETYHSTVAGHKIGGSPNLWESDFMPDGGQSDWNLLLQMESTDGATITTPFGVYYGDGGCGWWFISKDSSKVEYSSMCY
jgi:predicted DNA-binding WGR domain protein